ncbi:MAG: protein-glutamate O-methyltransferase [Spirochaetota bacterium]|nr:protein-glutamate O-methyltransferase [Spirochaetota bacterium]
MDNYNFTIQLSNNDFKKLRDLVYKNSGINLQEDKMSLMSARLGSILRSRKINSYSDYYDLVQKDESGQELIILLDAMTTNQTYFFREINHFNFLKDNILPEIIEIKKKLHDNKISLWSSACSSGEEPYSMALTIKDYFTKNIQNINWTLNILATDLSTRMLKKAEAGIYHKNEFAKVQDHLIKQFFQYGVDQWKDYLRVKKDIRNIINFKRLNLLENWNQLGSFDIIFCRNVLIYFDRNSQEKLIYKFYNQLNPNGYLIIGHSESLFNVKHKFKYIKPTIFKKH